MAELPNETNSAASAGYNKVHHSRQMVRCESGINLSLIDGTALQPGVSIVIPVYNSEQSLFPLVERLHKILSDAGIPYEVVLVNDGSRDNSWKMIEQLAAVWEQVHGICLMRNYGQHNALLCGIRAARHEIIVTLDDDLQNPPEEVPKLLNKLAEGYDVVYGTPQQEQHGLWRDIASIITKWALQSAMGAKTARMVSAFRAFRTCCREAFATYGGPYVAIDVLLTWATTRFVHIPVRHEPRIAGRSTYTFSKLVRHAMTMMTGFTVLPLRLATLLGFSFSLFGFGVLSYVVGRYLTQDSPVAGFPFLASTIAIFSGVQLFALGIIGEYIARMHFRLMDRPSYAIRCESTGTIKGD